MMRPLISRHSRPLTQLHYITHTPLYNPIPSRTALSLPIRRYQSSFERSLPLHSISAGSDPTWRNAVFQRLEDLHHTVQNYRRVLFRGAIGICVVGGWIFYVFGEEIKSHWARQGADMGKMVLSDNGLQLEAQELSKALAEKMLTDPNMEKLTVLFVRQVVDSLLASEETQRKTMEFLIKVIEQPESQQAVSKLMMQAINQPAFLAYIQDLANGVGLRVSHRVLHDNSVRQAATDLMIEVTKDEEVGKSTGELLWKACLHALTPSVLKMRAGQSHVDPKQ